MNGEDPTNGANSAPDAGATQAAGTPQDGGTAGGVGEPFRSEISPPPESGGGRDGAERPAGRREPEGFGFRLRLHLLDRQIQEPDGRLIAKIDDLELEPDEDGIPKVTAILTGAQALGPRMGGRLGRWMVAVARRLSDRRDPGPHRIGMDRVAEIGAVVTLAGRPGQVGIAPLEDWARTRVVERIPGSGHAS